MGPNYFRMASELASELRGDRRPWQASSELMVREAAWHMANKLRAGELPATSQVNELRAGEYQPHVWASELRGDRHLT